MERKKSLIIWPYGYYVDVVFTDDVAASRSKRSADIGVPFTSSAAALTAWNRSKFKSWLFYSFNASPGAIAHEALHCIERMWENIGVEVKVDEEIQAYTLHWLVDRIHNFRQSLTPKTKP